LSWTDASNNESLQQGKAGWIHNPVSAYIVAKQRKLPTADLINHHRSLSGPGGRHETDVPRSIGIWKFSKHVEPAKEWVRYLLGKREVYDEWIMSADAFNLPIYERLQDHPVLRTDPKYAGLGATRSWARSSSRPSASCSCCCSRTPSAWRSTSPCRTPSSAARATSTRSATSSTSGRATRSGKPFRTPSSSRARRSPSSSSSASRSPCC